MLPMQSNHNFDLLERSIQDIAVFNQILDALPIACCFLDNGRIIRMMNRPTELIFNIKKENSIGKDIFKAFPGCIDNKEYQLFQEELYQKHTCSCDCVLRPDGTHYRMEASPVEAGMIIYIVELPSQTVTYPSSDIKQEPLEAKEHEDLTNLEITSRKQAEEESNEDAMLIKGIADAVPDMLYVIDMENMQMVYANNHIVKLFDRSPVEIKALGMSFFEEIIYPEDRELFDDNIAALRRAADQDIIELTYRLVDSAMNLHWIRTKRTVFKRNKNGMPTHIIGVSEDITEQMELKQSVQQLQKRQNIMEKQTQQEVFKSTLITQEVERKRIAESLHNSLGQLLYGIKLSLNRINFNRGEHSDENQQVYQQSVNLLTDAINESRRISHELTPAGLETFGLKTAIEDICERFEPKIEFNNVFTGLYRRLDAYLEIAVYRIVQELILNMVKHAEANKASIQIEASKKGVKIHVEDNGKGFDVSTSKGWGIGLKTIQNRVNLLNGKLKIYAHPDTGTVVDIFIT